MKFVCNFCSVYIYDEEKGDPATGLNPGTIINNISPSWKCPIDLHSQQN